MVKTVLIIDDVGFDRIIISALLQQSGFEVIHEASNGIDGVKKAMELQPDLITLDIRMPDMNGLEVLESLTSKNYTKNIIMISGDDIDSIREEATKLGVKIFFNKPISRERLKTELSKLF
jgi:two-component system chemotaxis response regulator CheY